MSQRLAPRAPARGLERATHTVARTGRAAVFGSGGDWMGKHLGISLEEAKKTGAPLPVTALVDQFYAQVQARGGSRWDTSSLMQLLAKD